MVAGIDGISDNTLGAGRGLTGIIDPSWHLKREAREPKALLGAERTVEKEDVINDEIVLWRVMFETKEAAAQLVIANYLLGLAKCLRANVEIKSDELGEGSGLCSGRTLAQYKLFSFSDMLYFSERVGDMLRYPKSGARLDGGGRYG